MVHYTEFGAGLIKEGRIKPVGSVFTTMAYHDSCYIGRHNDIYDAPRAIAESIPGLTLVEMPNGAHHERSFCCGAGGGQMWMEEDSDKRVNKIRAEEIAATACDTVAIGCPFCSVMVKDGLDSVGSEMDVKDVAELLWEQIVAQIY